MLAIFLIFGFNESKEVSLTPKEKITSILKEYYANSDSSKVEQLPKFFSDQPIYWYGQENRTKTEIVNAAKAHNEKFPFRISEIDWKSLLITKEENNGYYVTYNMPYQSKRKNKDLYSRYNLKLITFWDADFKLFRITEIKL